MERIIFIIIAVIIILIAVSIIIWIVWRNRTRALVPLTPPIPIVPSGTPTSTPASNQSNSSIPVTNLTISNSHHHSNHDHNDDSFNHSSQSLNSDSEKSSCSHMTSTRDSHASSTSQRSHSSDSDSRTLSSESVKSTSNSVSDDTSDSGTSSSSSSFEEFGAKRRHKINHALKNKNFRAANSKKYINKISVKSSCESGELTNVSKTRTDWSLDKTLQYVTSDGQRKIAQISEFQGSEINAMQCTDKNLYVHIIGRGIYIVDNKENVKCFLATADNTESADHRLAQLDRESDTCIKSFSLANGTIYIFTEVKNWKLTKRGFKRIESIPKSISAHIFDSNTITYLNNGKISFNDIVLEDEMTESIKWEAGFRYNKNELYFITTKHKLMKAEIEGERLISNTVISNKVRAFDINDSKLCYMLDNGALYINNTLIETFSPTNRVILCLFNDRIYVSGCD